MQITMNAWKRALVVLAGAALLGLLVVVAARTSAGPREQTYQSPASNNLRAVAPFSWPLPTPMPTPTPPPPPTAVPTPPAQVSAAVEPPYVPPPLPREWSDAVFAGQVFANVNAQRAGAGLPPLATSGPLAAAAESYAHTLLDLGSLSHAAGGLDVWTRATSAGYGGPGPVGEALWSGTGPLGPDRTVSDWMASPPHAGIILNGGYTQGGVGCYGRDGGPKVVCVLIVAA